MADQIGPDYGPKRTWGEKVRRFRKAFTTKYEILILKRDGIRWFKVQSLTTE